MIAIPSPPSARFSSVGRSPDASKPGPSSHLDDEPVGLELVQDLHRALAVLVAVAHGVRAGLGHGELEVAERLFAEGQAELARSGRGGRG